MTEALDDTPWFAIERQLRDDPNGRERDALLERLEEAARQVKRALDSGLPPAEFQRGEGIRAGLLAGIDSVNWIWKRHHPAG